MAGAMKLLQLVAFCAGSVLAAVASAQGYPSRAIQVISPVQAGSAGDLSLRIVTQKIAENIGQSLIVENLPGAAGMICVERLNAEIASALDDPGVRERFASLGANPRPSTPDELADLTRRAYSKMSRIINEAGIKSD
jgi:tripartite-type tricarboxylate transporter receptor subunit TctC